MVDRSWPLQRKLLRAPEIGFNAELRRWFSDVDEDESLLGRKNLRDSLLIQATDSRSKALFKVDYFRQFVQKVHLKPTVIGINKDDLDERYQVAYRPIVILYFRQDLAAVTSGLHAVEARISFRLMNETTASMTNTKLATLATKIKNELAISRGYTFNKGKYLCKYHDGENGYDLQLYTVSDAEGEQVARKIVGIQNHTFVDDKFTNSNPKRNSENTPTTTTILGKPYKKPRWRPTATVRFMYAEIILHTLPDPRTLVDRSGLRPNPIELVLV